MNQYSMPKPINLFATRKYNFRTNLTVESNNPKITLHFGKIERVVTVLIIIAILVVSAFGFLMQADTSQPEVVVPVVNNSTATPSVVPSANSTNSPITIISPQIPGAIGGDSPSQNTEGLFERSPYMNSSVWKSVAQNAWAYFQPGQGIDSTSGLPAGSLGWNYFTDWDLGVYIQAVIDAQKLSLITPDQNWGSSIRLEKAVEFLENRDLVTIANSTSKIPYWFYSSTGVGYTNQSVVDIVDAGTLLVALNNLKTYNSTLAPRIDAIVYNNVHGFSNRTDYASLVSSIKGDAQTSTSIYSYYVLSGFAAFFPELKDAYSPERVLDNILAAPKLTTYGVTLPKSTISCEPLLYSFFYLNYNPKVATIVNQTYAAHEAKYNVTGEYVAFSEGNANGGDFIYEWVVLPNGDTWKITKAGSNDYINITPIIYTRVAVSFLSISNSTFAKDMCVYLEKAMLSPDQGYYAGAEYNANPIDGNFVQNVGCNTNGLILAAARYACR